MRLIDADAFKDYIRNALEETKHIYKDNGEWAKEITESFCKDIDEQPTVMAELRRGTWEPQSGGGYCCSECGRYAMDKADGRTVMISAKSKFCPNCGAKMEVTE